MWLVSLTQGIFLNLRLWKFNYDQQGTEDRQLPDLVTERTVFSVLISKNIEKIWMFELSSFYVKKHFRET